MSEQPTVASKTPSQALRETLAATRTGGMIMGHQPPVPWDEVVDVNLARAAQGIRRAILAIQQAGGLPANEFDQALKLIVSLRKRHLEATGRE